MLQLPRKTLLCLAGSAFFATAVVPFVLNAQTASPIERARAIALDESRSVVFVINEDNTISAFSQNENRFLIARKVIPLPGSLRSLLISPDGARIALFHYDPSGSARISVFNASEILSADSPRPALSYLLEEITAGRVNGRFSADGKKIFVAYGENLLYMLDTLELKRESFGVGGIPSDIVFDKAGNVLVLSEKSETLNIFDPLKRTVQSVRLGENPKRLIYNPVSDLAFVSHVGSDDVYAIDTKTRTVVRKVKAGSDPTTMAYDPASGDVFVAGNSSATLTVIKRDFSTKTVDLGLPTYFNSSPYLMFYAKSAKKLFIVNTIAAKVLVYDHGQGKITSEIATGPSSLDIIGSEKTGKVFLSYFSGNTLLEIDISSGQTRNIPAAGQAEEPFFSRPQGIAVDEEGNRIFVTNLGNDILTVIDGERLLPIRKIRTLRSLQAVGFQKTTKKLYAISPIEGVVAVIDAAKSNYPVKTIKVGRQPLGFSFNVRTNRIYVSNAADATVSVIDGARDEVMATIALSGRSYPLILAVDEKRNKIYSADYGGGAVAVIDGITNKVEKYIEVGQNPIWVHYVEALDRVLVTVEGPRKLVIIDPETRQITQEVAFEAAPYRIFFDPRSNYLYVNFRQLREVSVLRNDPALNKLVEYQRMDLPFWGETDFPFAMVATNFTTSLSFFTAPKDNEVVAVKNPLNNNNIVIPTWYASINNKGELYSVTAREELGISTTTPTIFDDIVSGKASWSVYYAIGAALVVIIAAGGVWLVRKRKASPSALA